MAEAHIFRQIEGVVRETSVPLPELGSHDVLVRISHSGLCGTDHAYLPYGIAIGHEGVGTVEKLGSEATRFHLGDRVGGGFLRNSCGNCRKCLSGREIMCHDRVIFGEADFSSGTIADYYASNENFLYAIPKTMSSEHAAPLQCAGATVYMALLKSYKPGDRVGIFGIGGLGHLAIQFASKLGAEVVVFSSKTDKEPEARTLGAQEFYLSSQVEELKAPVDVLLVCGGQPDWPVFLKKEVLSRSATIVPLAALEKLDLPFLPLLFNGYNFNTSLVASRGVHQDMLNFAATHRIQPTIERFPMTNDGVGKALQKLSDGAMRYRAVLVAT